MSYKTILVHLSNDKAHMTRLRIGIGLATRYEAHLVALYIATPISMPAEIAGRAASTAYLAEATEAARERAQHVRAEIESWCARQKLSWEWQTGEGDHLDILARHANYADLAVVSHSRAELVEDRVIFHVPEHLPLVAPCPVIVLPTEGEPTPIEGHVMIAWKECRQSARAVEDAIPVLKRAGKVTVLTVLPAEQEAVPGQALVAYLARHGVAAQAVNDINGGGIGEVILAHARQEKASLLVMGAYGHSRLREMVMGGVTRHVLNNLSVPVLLAH
ncbi:MAG: universal stress protein [Alphaproteobacteria bacterium]